MLRTQFLGLISCFTRNQGPRNWVLSMNDLSRIVAWQPWDISKLLYTVFSDNFFLITTLWGQDLPKPKLWFLFHPQNSYGGVPTLCKSDFHVVTYNFCFHSEKKSFVWDIISRGMVQCPTIPCKRDRKKVCSCQGLPWNDGNDSGFSHGTKMPHQWLKEIEGSQDILNSPHPVREVFKPLGHGSPCLSCCMLSLFSLHAHNW